MIIFYFSMGSSVAPPPLLPRGVFFFPPPPKRKAHLGFLHRGGGALLFFLSIFRRARLPLPLREDPASVSSSLTRVISVSMHACTVGRVASDLSPQSRPHPPPPTLAPHHHGNEAHGSSQPPERILVEWPRAAGSNPLAKMAATHSKA